MTYDENTCYWCGNELPRNKDKSHHAFYSFATDTLKTRRSFCCEEHILAFKAAAVYDPDEVPGSQYKLRPYAGRPKKCRWRKEGWCEFEDVPCDNCKGDVKP